MITGCILCNKTPLYLSAALSRGSKVNEQEHSCPKSSQLSCFRYPGGPYPSFLEPILIPRVISPVTVSEGRSGSLLTVPIGTLLEKIEEVERLKALSQEKEEEVSGGG